ncbi:MAG TPA: sigma-70 family RNA polymerase sigma factor [Spirochaetota bacterium]|nr:sigma-70 family RNA polymerase sigma factor [Spirochaetota bacterium]HPS88235.1 sigma-70 family RNA polymerase sigma factor [Spirochaetota bacterium]
MNIITGKVKKFTDIYSDFYSVVYNGIYAKIRNADISGDLAQEVFTRFYEKMDEVENPRKWLLGALRYVLLEHYKKNSVGTLDIDEIFFDTNIQYVNGFRDTRIILQEAFDTSENYKDERDRIIYELIAIKNYSYEEVARLMGLTKRQVNYKYKSVVDRIVDYLKKRGINNLEELL